MTVPITGDPTGALSRVTVVAPKVRLDVAIPSQIPLAQLIGTLLWHTGEQTLEAGGLQGGWCLQRLGGPPLDTAQSLAGLGVRDGEMLYFRPAVAPLPQAMFDDPVDGIGTVLRGQSGRWTGAATRRCALTVLTVVPALGVAPLLAHGPSWQLPLFLAAALAVLLALGGGALSRAFGDGVAGVCCGYAALPYAGLAGFVAPLGDRTAGQAGAASAAAAGAAMFVTAVLATALTGISPGSSPAAARPGPGAGRPRGAQGGYVMPAAAPGPQPPQTADPAGRTAPPAGAALLGGVVPAAAIALAGLGGLHWDGHGCAALAAALVLALMVLIPRVAYRVAGLPAAAVMLNAEDLRNMSTPLSAAELADRAVVADRVLTGATAGSAVAVAGCVAFAATAPGWTGLVLAAVTAGLLALRARILGGLAQRWWLIGSGLALAAFTAALAPGRLAQGVGLGADLAVAALLTAGAGRFALRPGRRLAPPWSRTGDLLELIGVILVFPLALALLGVFGYVRSLAG